MHLHISKTKFEGNIVKSKLPLIKKAWKITNSISDIYQYFDNEENELQIVKIISSMSLNERQLLLFIMESGGSARRHDIEDALDIDVNSAIKELEEKFVIYVIKNRVKLDNSFDTYYIFSFLSGLLSRFDITNINNYYYLYINEKLLNKYITIDDISSIKYTDIEIVGKYINKKDAHIYYEIIARDIKWNKVIPANTSIINKMDRIFLYMLYNPLPLNINESIKGASIKAIMKKTGVDEIYLNMILDIINRFFIVREGMLYPSAKSQLYKNMDTHKKIRLVLEGLNIDIKKIFDRRNSIMASDLANKVSKADIKKIIYILNSIGICDVKYGDINVALNINEWFLTNNSYGNIIINSINEIIVYPPISPDVFYYLHAISYDSHIENIYHFFINEASVLDAIKIGIRWQDIKDTIMKCDIKGKIEFFDMYENSIKKINSVRLIKSILLNTDEETIIKLTHLPDDYKGKVEVKPLCNKWVIINGDRKDIISLFNKLGIIMEIDNEVF